jgi:PTH1 family peptidyl-tRNA hydrolase
MKLIVGLGNPGREYEMSRHNIGFMAIEGVCVRLKMPPFRNESKFKCEISRGEFNGEKIILLKPLTFMNLSGEAVQAVKQFYKLNASDVWTLYDDVDLPLGTLRIRSEGSPGTHNGMKSLTQCLSTENFPRFRLGIESRGLSSPPQQDLSSFVLESFRSEELPQVRELTEKAAEAVAVALKKGLEAAQQQYSA